jgi:hypothetical protein
MQQRSQAFEVLRAHANSSAGRAALLTAQSYDYFDNNKLAGGSFADEFSRANPIQ